VVLSSNQPFRDLIAELYEESCHHRSQHISMLLQRAADAIKAAVADLATDDAEHIIGVLQADRKVAKAESARWSKRVENFRNQTLTSGEMILLLEKMRPKDKAHIRKLFEQGRLL
jgi:hypothetical protein